MKLKNYLLKEEINASDRKQITKMIINGKGSVNIDKNVITLKNKEMTFKKNDALFIAIVEILDTLGYDFKKTKNGLELK